MSAVKKNAKWVSAETETKERHFRGLLGMHVDICKSILHKQGAPPYLYVDLHAGRGDLMYNGRQFDGSPLIARDLLSKSGIRNETLHYERDLTEASYLIEAMFSRASTLFDFGEQVDYPVCIEPFEAGFTSWLDERGPQPSRFGLIYSDPISDQIPVDLFNKAAKLMPKVDLLAYVSANSQYKRPRREAEQRGVAKPFLSDHIHAINKQHVLLREPLPGDGQQWTFIVWTNWKRFPEWEQQGFHRLNSARGQRIIETLDFSKNERHERANTPLFQLPRPDDAPYRGYREYLRHPRFLEIRAEVFRRAENLCERCMDRTPTEPHHLRYPPWGTFDVPENMIAVCHGCHCEIHGKAS